MLKQLPLILAAGRITQLCHPWVLQKSTDFWPEIIFLNQTKMSSVCRAITVNVRERYASTGQLRKTSDELFHQQRCHESALQTSMRSDVTNSDSGLFLKRHGNKYLCKGEQICFLPRTNMSHMIRVSQ